MSEAIVLTREFDGSYTVGVGESLILSDLSRITAHGFVATYRRLAAASVPADRSAVEAARSEGGRLGQAVHRSPSVARPLIRIARKPG